jgi:hypothetical protein
MLRREEAMYGRSDEATKGLAGLGPPQRSVGASMKTKVGPLVGLTIGVSVVAALVGAFFGGVAGQMYVSESVRNKAQLASAGMWWGGGSGFVVGLLWCQAMIARAVRFGPRKLGRIGAVCGLVAGALSTLVLHIALARVAGLGGLGMLDFGMVVGLPAGLVVGAICGSVCRAAVRQAVRGTENARWTEVCAEERGEE